MQSKRLKKIPILIWFFLALFLVRAFVYAYYVPPWQGPDEPQHYDYIHYIQTEKKLPVLGDVILCSKVRNSLDSFYFNMYAREKSPYAEFGDLNTAEKKNILPVHDVDKSSKIQRNQIIQHPPLYYILGAIITYPFKEGSLLNSLFVLRFMGIILGLGVVMLTYFIASTLYENNRYFAFGATAFVAINPQFTHIMTLVNNDSVTNFLFALFLFLLVKSIKSGLDNKGALLIGIVIGLGMLSKIFFALAFIMLFLAFIFFRKTMTTSYKLPLISLSTAIFLSAPYYTRNILIYGTIQPVYRFRSFSNAVFKKMSLLNYLIQTNYSRKLIISFWSNFGWILPRFTSVYYRVLMVFVFLAITGLFVYLLKLGKKKDWLNLKLMSLFIFAPLFLITVITILSFEGAKTYGVVEGVQGRYLFSLLPIIGLMFFVGIKNLLPLKKGYFAFLIITIGMVVLDLSAIFYYILPYFYF